MKAFLFLAAFILFPLAKSNAQTAAYLCSQTGAYGYCYGNSNVNGCAYNMCVKYGGTSPYSVFSTSSKGYGALVVGTGSNGVRVIGASGGYSSGADAVNRAKNECISRGGQNIYVADTWNDQN
ncbi:hypothetical protein E5K00_00950 [Hymenobacter aquaticus]|uniref:DUF4189 domain-containing protein n=1 Tax=Hymenobacter aquaticus TaxID=1867101 RepID=A0A4Z0Q2A0_9BACT|nr:hypothetical protein [Hymenobacter aquaticus]TGE23815.1 hypothetical protein E5K00_00950 [Hymenobacter aquaticus]